MFIVLFNAFTNAKSTILSFTHRIMKQQQTKITKLHTKKSLSYYMESIKYSIYIRENSIEYNQPTLQPARAETPISNCLCCGHSPTILTVRDQISTIYFDDVLMDSVRNDTRSCNPLHTFCCGGRGEEVRLESRFCWDGCYRGRSLGTENCGLLNSCCCCVPCVPVGCPECLCPCAARVSTYEKEWFDLFLFVLRFPSYTLSLLFVHVKQSFVPLYLHTPGA